MVEGDGAAGIAPLRSFAKNFPGSNSAPLLAKAEPIKIAKLQKLHFRGETTFVLGAFFCFRGIGREWERQ